MIKNDEQLSARLRAAAQHIEDLIKDTSPTNPHKGRGVFLHKSVFGYTPVVDGVSLKMDISWSECNELCGRIAKGRKKGDGRGYGRCDCPDRNGCFDAWRCLRIDEPG